MNHPNKLHKISICVLATATLATLCTATSAYIVRGVVNDVADNSPCPGAIVRVYSESDTIMPLATTITDSLGHFSQSVDTAGAYRLCVEFMGMKSPEKELLLSAYAPEIKLDTIFMTSDTETLEEFVVSVRKPLVENDGATLTYNMAEDPMAQSNTLLEMLRKVPMVTVDAEENIKVKGKSNFKIYLNGREDPMLSGDPKTILKSMPASTIKKVEVITEPGAKYDAEGTDGILNIVTIQKQNLEGVTGNLSGGINRNSTGSSAYVRTKVRNVTGSVNISYNHSVFPSLMKYTSESVTENLVSERDRKIVNKGTGHYGYSYTGGGFNLSWEPDTLNLFTAQASIGDNSNTSWTTQQMIGIDANDVERWSLRRVWTARSHSFWTSVQASYQHTFKREGHHIVASYQYDFNTNDRLSDMETDEVTGVVETYPWRRNQSDGHSNTHTLQFDYSNPMGEHNVFEAGGKVVFTRNNNMSAPSYGDTPEDLTIRESERVSMAQFRNIQALYVSHTGRYGKLGTRVGLRYEHTETGLDYFTPGYTDFSSSFNDLVPNVSVTYRLNGMQNFRLGYQMRIWRPSIYQLNPYVNTMTVGEISYGNPDLKSEHDHNLTLSYNNYGGKIGGSTQLGYSHTGNSIEGYNFATDNLIHSTYANIGKLEKVDLSGDLQIGIINNLSISLFGYISYRKYMADSEYLKAKRNGWFWNYNVNIDYRAPWKMAISGFGGQGSKWFNLQSSGDSWYYYGVQLSRTFLKDDKLRINLYAQTFFNPYRVSHTSNNGDGTRSEGFYRQSQWHAGIGVSWQFGKLNADVKRTGATIESVGEAQGGAQGGR